MLPHPRRRPLWLVVVLSVLSLGAYIPIWFGLTWAELRRETHDESMSPLAHALSIFVPVYGVWQAHRHFAALDALLRRVDAQRGVDPFAAAVATGIWWLTLTHYSTDPIFLALDVVELFAGTAVVAYGQRALNAYWRARPGPPVEERLTELDWLVLGVTISFAFLTALVMFTVPG
ncbi:MAG TPA: hypothetical protein VJP45_09500 [Candidatus Limnocylindria bacterium]|nr:hypothetical protein [Candidatus Limnocylindria bacterium]